MDSVVINFLKVNNFEEYLNIFRENEIDAEALQELSYNGLRDLITKVGPRDKFFKKMLDWQARNRSQIDVLQNSQELGDPDVESNKSIMASSDDSRSSTSTEEHVQDVVLVPDLELQREIEAALKSSMKHYAFSGEENIKKAFSTSYHLDLKQFLENTNQGKFILTTYKTEKCLTRKARNILVDVLVNALLSMTEKITSVDFENFSKKICELFPTESQYTYYVPRVPLRESIKNKALNAKGKLIDKYRNLKRLYKKYEPTTSRTQPDEDDDEFISDDMKESQIWLKNWSEPWDLVKKHWENSFSIRRQSQVVNIHDFFEEWPILTKQMAIELVEIDFTRIFKNNHNSLFSNWDNFFSKLLTLKNTENELLQQYLSMDLNNENSRRTIEIMLLPLLFPPKGRTKKGKPSIAECTESIISHVKIPGDIETFIKNKSRSYGNNKLQPYMIVTGSDITNITSTYVVVEENMYTCKSVMQGLDYMFKVFHVFTAEYPPESEHIWYLIQLSVYGISTKWDKKIPYVFALANELKN